MDMPLFTYPLKGIKELWLRVKGHMWIRGMLILAEHLLRDEGRWVE
jgi:hypothetical protein